MQNHVTIGLPRGGIDTMNYDAPKPKGYVVDAVNVDLDSNGRISRRYDNRALADLGSPGHSLFKHPTQPYLYAGRSDGLVRVHVDTGEVTPVAGVPKAVFYAYALHTDFFYVSCPLGVFQVFDDATADTAALPRPGIPKVWQVTTAGGLARGRYTLCTVAETPDGRESPASTPLTFVVDADGSALVVKNPPSAQRLALYITAADGTVMRRYGSSFLSSGDILVTGPGTGQECRTQNLYALPGGHVLLSHKGRLYSAAGDTLYFSQPFRPDLCLLYADYIQMHGRITVLAGVDDGIFIGDDAGVWFLGGGDPTTAKINKVSTEPALENSMVHLNASFLPSRLELPADEVVTVWNSPSGFYVGMSGGRVRPLNNHALHGIIPTATASRGDATVVNNHGTVQVVACAAIPSVNN